MGKNDLLLLDCTLRDGGYINDWKWGFHGAQAIIQALVRAKIDVVEVGFLRNIDCYNQDISVCNHIEELNRLLPDEIDQTMFSAMAMRSNYDINKLSPYSGSGIEMIRVTAHDYDIAEGITFAREVKDKGYKVSINPINIMGYSDERILWIIDQVNAVSPYQFSIVDTFGSMRRRDLDRIVSLVDNNLDHSIRIALHLHENMSLSFCLAQNFVDKHLNRPVSIDGSLMGMGRIPGNLPIELIADYLNEYSDKDYDIDHLMDAIQDYIAPLKGKPKWGYTPAYFLSAKFNLHRNYAEHYLNKGDLTNKDINHLLARIENEKKTVFDAKYADDLYSNYQDQRINDSVALDALENALKNKKILLLAPGLSIKSKHDQISAFVEQYNPIVIAVNFIPESISVDYVFFSNNKRFDRIDKFHCKVIISSNLMSNVTKGLVDYIIDYDRLSAANSHGNNSLLMLLKLMVIVGVKEVSVAGADGFIDGKMSYYSSDYKSNINTGSIYNRTISDAITRLGIRVNYITPSAYNL